MNLPRPRSRLARPRSPLVRALVRATAISVCMALSVLGLVAAPAHASGFGPASAIRAGAAAATSLPTITYPGGDVTVSIDDGGIDPSVATQAINNFETGLGLSAGADLGSIIQALYQKNSGVSAQLAGVTPYFPDPPVFSGGSLSVSGSTITASVPAADLPASVTGKVPGVVAGFLGALVGGIVAIFTFAVCWAGVFLFTGPGAAFITPLCNSIAWFFWSFVGIAFADWLNGIPLTSKVWITILIYSLANLGIGFGWPYLAKWVTTKFPIWLGPASTRVRTFLNNKLGWFSDVAEETAAEGAVAGAIEEIEPAVAPAANGAPAIQMGAIVGEANMPVPEATGTVGSEVAGNCMDAYGANGSLVPGQIAAINSCNGNLAQSWTTWADHAISVFGGCLDASGGTASDGGTLVDVAFCNGQNSQVWSQVGNAVVNKATGNCLADPAGNTSPGTQLEVKTCNGLPAQQWTLPGSNKPPSSGRSCDLYAFYGTPCVGAYSTVRALYSGYAGPLYQVQRASDGTTRDIGLISPGTWADASQQDSFCGGTTCIITKLYDQSPQGNDLPIAPAGGNGAADHGANAAALPITIHGYKAYGVDVTPGVGYRDNSAVGTATNGKPEGMYMVASGTNVNSQCCFDFGNVETDNNDHGAGTMDAVNFSTSCGSNSSPCTGSGPWVEADLENGLWMGNGPNPNNLGNSTDFVTALLKNNGQTTFALKGGDATSGLLSTWYDDPLPAGYAPMKQQGAIVMGTGGDNSNKDVGSFFEGVMTAGYPSDAADDAVQADIVAAGYGGSSGSPGGGNGLTPPAGTITMAGGKCVDVLGDDSGVNGTVIDSWDCQSTAVDQHWTHNADGSLETLGRCLNISVAPGVGGSGTAVAGDRTTLWDCNGSGVEKWVQQPDGTLVNPPTGLCLYGQPTNQYQLQVVQCNPSDPDQHFSVNGGNPVTNPASGKCVDVLGDDTGTNGTPIDMWTCQQGAVDQHWIYDPGTLELRTLGRCLGVSVAQGVGGTGTAVAGNRTTLWGCNDSGVEQWVQLPNGTLVNFPTGLCLYGQPVNQYQLQVVHCNPSDPNQHFSVYNAGAVAGSGVAAPAGTITGPGGKCVDVMGNDSGTNGTVVDQWGCQSGAVDQHWTLNSDGSLETLGRCLDVSVAQGVGGTGTAMPGDRTTLWDCNGSGVEKWREQPNGTLINPPSQLCLDDPNGSTADGWQLQVWACMNGDANQQFSVNGGSPIIDEATGKCVDVAGDDNGTDGTVVDLWDCQQAAADQHWFYNSSSHTLRTLGKCLNVSVAQGVGGTGTAVTGDHTTLWGCNGSGVEQWVPQSDGTVINPPSGLCLDDAGGHSATNGWQLQVFGCNSGDPNQQFGVFDTGVHIINPVAGSCVDVLGSDTGTNGTPVDMWTCQPTATDQHWKYTSTGRLVTLGRCLNVSVAPGVGGTGKAVIGDHVTLWDCNGSNVEYWVFRSDGTLQNPASGLCLSDPNDSPTGGTPDGTQLQVNACQNLANYSEIFIRTHPW
jgi:non-reducing end alpha-L-arabinofuranosidase